MQFELVADKILIFWQSMADLERTFDFLNSKPLGEFSDYIPTGDLIPWEIKLISYSGGDKGELLRYLVDKISEFLKDYRQVDQSDGEMIIYLPEDFTFDKYLADQDLTS
ncbi:MAG TPA: hypothetical protein VKK79_24935 [Candidatus Lokiarchaeia archaeon]|nr:hypothetical protein [Candidatus Lokiarchaeia archaeon]